MFSFDVDEKSLLSTSLWFLDFLVLLAVSGMCVTGAPCEGSNREWKACDLEICPLDRLGGRMDAVSAGRVVIATFAPNQLI